MMHLEGKTLREGVFLTFLLFALVKICVIEKSSLCNRKNKKPLRNSCSERLILKKMTSFCFYLIPNFAFTNGVASTAEVL